MIIRALTFSGSRRKQHGTRGDGMMDEGSCAGSVCGSGSRETVLDGGGDEGEMVCGTTVTAEVERTGGGEAAAIGGNGKDGEARDGQMTTTASPRVGAAAGGIMISGVGLFDNSGACNGGLLPSVSTASPMDLLTVRKCFFFIRVLTAKSKSQSYHVILMQHFITTLSLDTSIK